VKNYIIHISPPSPNRLSMLYEVGFS